MRTSPISLYLHNHTTPFVCYISFFDNFSGLNTCSAITTASQNTGSSKQNTGTVSTSLAPPSTRPGSTPSKVSGSSSMSPATSPVTSPSGSPGSPKIPNVSHVIVHVHETEHTFLFFEKREEVWLSPVTKARTPTENSKHQNDNTKMQPQTPITQRFWTDLGRSVWVMTAISSPNVDSNFL